MAKASQFVAATELVWRFCLLLAFLGLQMTSASHPSNVPTCFPSDRDALLQYKAGQTDSRKDLTTWKTSKSCCSWNGVTCNAQGRVIKLVVDSKGGLSQTNPGIDLIGTTLSKLKELEVLSLSNVNGLNNINLPAGLKTLRKLTTLSLVGSRFKGPIPAEWSDIVSLQNLNLSLNPDISGSLPESICRLKDLQTLSIANTDIQPATLTGPIPACIGSLSGLVKIELSYNQISGSLPSSIGSLQNLISLLLTHNLLEGPIPDSFGDLAQLQTLWLQGNELTGDIPASLGKLTKLRDVRLGGEEGDQGALISFDRGLTGSIPSSIGNSKGLVVLRIRGTSVSGSIPDSLGKTHLRQLVLSDNALTGAIPGTLSRLKKLTILDLGNNKLTGNIPVSLAKLKRALKTLSLGSNQLSGEIPTAFSNLALESLDLSNNKLTGSIPENLGNAVIRGNLDLSRNSLTGAFPTSLWNATTIALSFNQLSSLPSDDLGPDNTPLTQLYIDNNDFSGTIPPWVFQMQISFFVDLSVNKFVSPLPSFGENFRTTVSRLNISHNRLSGDIPQEFGNIQSLNSLDLSFNSFSGPIPSNFSSGSFFLNNLVLSHNQLSGPIPDDIFSSIFFNTLDLSHNQLTGSIPTAFPDSSPFLNFLDFSYNQLSGEIPAQLLSYSAFIQRVKLDHNRFTGPVPNLGTACQEGLGQLNFVSLNDNLLTGDLASASWLSQCAGKLSVLDISGNELTGAIPDLSSWTTLQVLGLAHNKLSGPIPSFLFTDLPSLQVLDLSGNSLTGALPLNSVSGLAAIINSTGADLPPVLGGPYYDDGVSYTRNGFLSDNSLFLTTTAAIDVSSNSLAGTLSPNIGSLSGLHVLNLASNSFSGALPQSLGSIPGLQVLNVAHNHFSGPIPKNLAGFPASDFAGNPALCGAPLATPCP